MDADQVRAKIRTTLNETYLDFYRRIPHEPRSRRLPEYIEVSSRESFKRQCGQRFKGMVGQAALRKKRDEVKRLEREERERREEEARAARRASNADKDEGGDEDEDGEGDDDVTMDEEEDVTMDEDAALLDEPAKPPPLAYDGACSFWIDPDVPPMQLLLGDPEPNPEPPSITGPSTNNTVNEYDKVKRESKLYTPSYEPKTCYQATAAKPRSLVGCGRKVKTYHRPGFMEPLTHGDYLPRSAYQVKASRPTGPARSLRNNPDPTANTASTTTATALTTKGTLTKLAVDLSTYGALVKPTPPYIYCDVVSSILWVAEQQVLQFYPIFPDETDLKDEDFGKHYENRHAWEDMDRDPDSE